MSQYKCFFPTNYFDTLRREFVHLLEPRINDHFPDVIQAREVVESDAGGAEIDQVEAVEMFGDDLQAFDRQRRQIGFGARVLRPEERWSAVHRTRVRVGRGPVRIPGILMGSDEGMRGGDAGIETID